MPAAFLRRALVVMSLATLPLAGGCSSESGDGGTPVGPSPPVTAAAPPPSGVATIAGTWRGDFAASQNGTQSNSTVTATITQSDRSVSGTISFSSPGWETWRATVSGTLAGPSPDTEFVGSIEIRSESLTGTGICIGQAVFAGKTGSSLIRWDAQSISVDSNVPPQPAHACRGTLLRPAWVLQR